MANVIKLKRGSGSDPSASDLVVGEVAIRTDSGKLFTKKDNGTIAEISGSGGGSDIFINTLSSSSGSGGGSATFNGTATRFTLSNPPAVSAQQLLVSINGVIQKPNSGTSPSEGFAIDGNDIIFAAAPATGSDFFIVTYGSLNIAVPADNSVTSAKIVDGAIVNADINASAAIAGTKISPSFGNQDIQSNQIQVFGKSVYAEPTSEDFFRIKFNDTGGINNDVGIGQPDASSLAFNTISNGTIRFYNGTDGEMMRLDASGRLGLGTISPGVTLDIEAVTPTIRLTDSDASGTPECEIRGGGGDLVFSADRDDEKASTLMQFQTDGSTAMTIDSSQRVLIGGAATSQGSTNADDLQIGANNQSNQTGITLGSATASSIRFADASDDSAGYILYNHGTNELGLNSSGTVKISGTNLNMNSAYIDFSGSISTPSTAAAIYRPADNTLAFSTANTQRMTIDGSGRVMIGVNDTSHASGNADDLCVGNNDSSAAHGITIGSNNAGSIRFSDSANGSIGIINYDHASDQLAFYTHAAVRITVQSSGAAFSVPIQLGSGNSHNSAKLVIQGSGNATSTNSVFVKNSDETPLFQIRNDGAFFTGIDGNSPYNLTTSSAVNCFISSDGTLRRKTSSVRYKKDIADATWGLADVLKLKPKTFKSNNTGEFADDKTYAGFTAEDIHDLGLTEFVQYNEANEPDALAYGEMVALMAKAIQDLNAKVEALEEG